MPTESVPHRARAADRERTATPILVVQGFMYTGGSFRSVLLKGIDPRQRVLSLPTAVLDDRRSEVPALIGTRMARDAGLKVGDLATVRWRDARGNVRRRGNPDRPRHEHDRADGRQRPAVAAARPAAADGPDGGRGHLDRPGATDIGRAGTSPAGTSRTLDFLLSDLHAHGPDQDGSAARLST